MLNTFLLFTVAEKIYNRKIVYCMVADKKWIMTLKKIRITMKKLKISLILRCIYIMAMIIVTYIEFQTVSIQTITTN